MTQKSKPVGSSVRTMALMMIMALLLQFLLGMYTNLFISLPRTTMRASGLLMPGMGHMMSAGILDPVFMAHMVVGMLLAIGAVATVIVAVRVKHPFFVIITIIGLIAVLIAGYGGIMFFMNGEHNSESYTMAIGWLSAFTTYFMVLSASTR